MSQNFVPIRSYRKFKFDDTKYNGLGHIQIRLPVSETFLQKSKQRLLR